MTKKQVKILYIVTQGEMGGAQKYVYDMATSLSSRGGESRRGDPNGIASGVSPRNDVNYDIVVAMGKERSELGKKLEEAGIKTVYLKNLVRNINPIRDIMGLMGIKGLIKRENPDIIHLNSSKAGVIGSIAGRMAGNKNIIFTAHGLAYQEPRPWPVKQIYFWTEKFASYFRKKIIVINSADYKQALKDRLAPKDKFVLIHNGIEEISLLPREEAREKLAVIARSFAPKQSQRDRFVRPPQADGTRDDSINVGAIAHDYPSKDLKTLRRAFKILKNEMSLRGRSPKQSHGTAATTTKVGPRSDSNNLKLVIIGRGNEYGEIPDAKKYLPAFDIYVSSSVKEGLPYSLMEAALAGIPIVATDVGGVPDIINSPFSAVIARGAAPKQSQGDRRGPTKVGPRDDEKLNGILVEPKNPEALAEAMRYMIENPDEARQMAEKAKKRVEQEFTLEKMKIKTLEVYENIIDNRGLM